MVPHDPLPPTGQDAGQLAEAFAATRRENATLHDALDRARGALAAIADGVAVTDLEGRITSLNPVAAHLTGWNALEALARNVSEVVRLVDAGGIGVDPIRSGFRNRDDVMSLVRRDGHVILVDGAVAEILDDLRRPLGHIITFRNVTAATRLSRELSWHANHDALTGLLNRRVLEARLQRATDSAGRLGCRHSLLYVDLDRFKAVNDSGGHVAGDELLRQLSMALRRQLREGDTLARIGGDEFAVLLENTAADQAGGVARKLIETVEQFRFAWQGFGYRLGASVGLVEFSGVGLEAEDVIEAADRMCYVAKEEGRGRVAADVLRAVRPGARPASIKPVSAEPVSIRPAPATGRSARSAGPASERRS
jgi:diguanylate cyclase (GGDEF)-like protein/PAS domain S-box-containing protein